MSADAKRKDINVLYSIGAILAVFGHSHPNNWSSFAGTVFYHTIVFIYTFHMPLFFVIAGILLYNSKSIRIKSFSQFIKEKAFKLLTPYVVLSAIFLIPKGYVEHGSLGFLSFEFIVKSFLIPRQNIWGHFWFLPTLFICYFVLGGCKKLVARFDKKFFWWIVLPLCAISIGFWVSPIKTNWFALKDVTENAFYMVLGMALALCEKRLVLKPNKCLMTICSIVLAAVSVMLYIFKYSREGKMIISICMVLALLLFAKLIGSFLQKQFDFISKNVFVIYICSWIFQSLMMILLEKLHCKLAVMAPMLFVIGIAAPIVIASLYKKTKKLNCKFFDLCLGVR